MSVVLAEKTCGRCTEVKPLSEFHRDRARFDGRARNCKPCESERVRAAQERRRQRIGEAAYLAARREATARWRERNGMKRDKQQAAAYRDALAALRDRHRDEFDALYQRERYERGLS